MSSIWLIAHMIQESTITSS